MFDEIRFSKMDNLPDYAFAKTAKLKKLKEEQGFEVIDLSMGNPDGSTPKHIITALCDAVANENNHGYSSSEGIYELRAAICSWYKNKFNVSLDPNDEVVATIGSKEGYVHLAMAIVNPGDKAIVPDPAYPIHREAFIIAGAKTIALKLSWDENFELDEDDFFSKLDEIFKSSNPKPKYLIANFPHNPTTVVARKSFFEKLVKYAKEKRFYIISDIAYAELTFDNFKATSILEIPGAKDVAVECYTLSKSYNMAGWRVGFFAGNKRLVSALKKIKSWFDYGIFTPVQMAAIAALNGDQSCVEEIKNSYARRRDFLLKAFKEAGWDIGKPRASMFAWARIPEPFREKGSDYFARALLEKANIALSPGEAFGEAGKEYVRIAFIEDEEGILKAAKNLKEFLKDYK